MKLLFPALAALVPLFFTPQDDAVKSELARLDGDWQVVAHETEGKAANEEHWQMVQFVIRGNQLTFKGDGILSKKVAKIALVIDPATTPRVIDLKVVEGEFKGTMLAGIYEVKGDRLKICFRNDETNNRPNEFSTKDDSNLVLFVLQRNKK
jgi:uncharacterized protein (TIGR03067 family)